MESPQTSKRKISGDDVSLSKINCTPKNQRSGILEGLGLYNFHRESSPNFRAGQDVLEVGWGDSPEPLNVDKKFERNKTPVNCKKKLETKESPKSSISFARRGARTSFSFPSKSIVDVAKYVAEVQELSKNIMKEFNAQKNDKDLFEDEPIFSNDLIESNLASRLSPSRRPFAEGVNESNGGSSSNQNKDPTFDRVLQSFINEEDDWLSQALTSQEQTKTPHKGHFVKSKSENELTLPQSAGLEKPRFTTNKNLNNNFRRTSSFDLTKPENKEEKNAINGSVSSNQYSLQEIERKRLEAKYRRERKEIERKKLEALKKLEMKKSKAIRT